MDRRRVFRNAFLWNALVSALMAGAALYARSGARGWLAAGWCIGVAASAAALACFCKAWAAAPDGTAVTGWYLLRVAAMLAAVAGTAAFSMEGALGAILPQLAQVPVGAVFFCIDILPLLTSFVFSFTLKVSSLRKPMTFS